MQPIQTQPVELLPDFGSVLFLLMLILAGSILFLRVISKRQTSAVPSEELPSTDHARRRRTSHSSSGSSGSDASQEEVDELREMLEEEDNVPDELDQRVSALEEELEEAPRQAAQNTEDLGELNDKTDRMVDQFTEVNTEILDRLEGIEERMGNRNQIRNRRE